MASDYEHGSMDITAQKKSFDGIMVATTWSCLLLFLSGFYFVLVFAVGNDWLETLIGVTIAGLAVGFAMGMKISWYVTVIGLCVSGFVIGGISMLAAAAFSG